MLEDTKQIRIRKRRFEAGLNNPKKDKWAKRVRKVECQSEKITCGMIEASKIKDNAIPNIIPIIKKSWWQKIIKFIKGIWKSKK